MNMVLAVMLGGGLGSLARFYALSAANTTFGDGFPYGTLLVNVVGSFIIGALMEVMAFKWQVSLEMRAFLVTGVLGGFTTFSAFSFDVLKLVDTGKAGAAAVYVAASVVLSLTAVFGAAFIVRGMVGNG